MNLADDGAATAIGAAWKPTKLSRDLCCRQAVCPQPLEHCNPVIRPRHFGFSPTVQGTDLADSQGKRNPDLWIIALFISTFPAGPSDGESARLIVRRSYGEVADVKNDRDDSARERGGQTFGAGFEVFCLIFDYFKENRRPIGAATFAAAVGWTELLARTRLNRMAELGSLNRSQKTKRPLRYVYWFKQPQPIGGNDVL